MSESTAGYEPDRNLALELVRATEAAALAASRWVGRGEKDPADQAAVDGMRALLRTVAMTGTVVIGEGEKDQAPMLYNGELVGSGSGPAVDVAVDPLEGTELAALALPNAVSAIAVAERGTILAPTQAYYMEKIVTGPAAAAEISLDVSPAENVKRVAAATGKRPAEVTVVVLNRAHNASLIAELREVGAHVSLIPHGDTAPAVATALRHADEPVDLVMGIGGCTEGILAAAAVKCLGGAIQARLWPKDAPDRQRMEDLGYPVDRILTTNDLVAGEDVFVAITGVTSGALLRGVRHDAEGATTDSIVMRSRSGTVRRIQAEHAVGKLAQVTGVDYRRAPAP
jgi:fructose-1,6-bisphosphatase II